MAQRILIRTPNHLGDCIMALPMVNETREAYPGAEISILVPDILADIYRFNPDVDRIITLPIKQMHGLIAIMKVKDAISEFNFDRGFILPPSFGAAAGFKLAGVKNRIGYIADGRRILLTQPMPLPEPLNSEHRSRLYFNLLLRASGADIDYVQPKLFLNDDDMEKARAVLGGFDFGEDEPYAVIAFRAVAESRRWGAGKYTELVKSLVISRGLRVILMGGVQDQPEGDEIVASAGPKQVANLAGKTSIRESAAIMSNARFFIGNDSGPGHLAAAVGCPIVILSGADDPSSTSPISNRKRLLYRDNLKCISCVKNKCPLRGDDAMRCMVDISVEDVLAEIKQLG